MGMHSSWGYKDGIIERIENPENCKYRQRFWFSRWAFSAVYFDNFSGDRKKFPRTVLYLVARLGLSWNGGFRRTAISFNSGEKQIAIAEKKKCQKTNEDFFLGSTLPRDRNLYFDSSHSRKTVCSKSMRLHCFIDSLVTRLTLFIQMFAVRGR